MLTNWVRSGTFQTVSEAEFHVHHNGKVKKTSKCHGSPYRTPWRVYIETTSNQLFFIHGVSKWISDFWNSLSAEYPFLKLKLVLVQSDTFFLGDCRVIFQNTVIKGDNAEIGLQSPGSLTWAILLTGEPCETFSTLSSMPVSIDWCEFESKVLIVGQQLVLFIG